MKSTFPKLDSIRFYAFLLVFFSHSYFNSKVDLSGSYPILLSKGDRWFAHGEIGVQIFFMLSGFLIMYLSLQQIKKRNSFSIIHFFKKRILRIWPLYFLVVAISYGLYYLQGNGASLGCTSMFLYFLGNVCLAKGMPDIVNTTILAPLWSVSIEQQFYILFPFLFAWGLWAYRKNKSITTMFTSLIMLALYAYALYARYMNAQDWSYISYSFLPSLPSLLTGIILAIVVVKYQNFFTRLAVCRKILITVATLSVISALFIKFSGDLGVAMYIVSIFVATGSMILLSVFDTNTQESKFGRITQFLGKISYGLYVYHMIAIVIVNYIYKTCKANPELFLNIYSKIILSFGLTILMAWVSYQYIEKWFLKFK